VGRPTRITFESMRELAERVRHRAVDLALLGLAIAGLIEPLSTSAHVDRALLAGLLPLAALSLLPRRRFPLPAPAVSMLVLAVASAFDGRGVNDLATTFLVGLSTAVAFGSIPDTREAIAGLAVTMIGIEFIQAHFPNHHPIDYVWVSFFFGAAWFVGFLLRRRTLQTAELRRRAEAAERAREDEAVRAVAEERARIARELHDVIAHSVSVMVVQAAGVRRLLPPEQERERQALETVEKTGRQALAEMRRLLGVLRTETERPELRPQPGLTTIEQLVEQIRTAGLPVDLAVEGEPVELPPGIDLAAFRIVQEALTNTLKHAGPAHAWVRVRYGPRELELTVSNDGQTTAVDADGYGLVGMKERVHLYGGTLEAGPRHGGGYSVSARLPLEGGR
jgi:signal transduction histidine kinase